MNITRTRNEGKQARTEMAQQPLVERKLVLQGMNEINLALAMMRGGWPFIRRFEVRYKKT